MIQGLLVGAAKSAATGVIGRALGGIFGKKKPMIIYGPPSAANTHPGIDQARYNANRPNDPYREAVNASYSAHLAQFGSPWTSTTPTGALHDMIRAQERNVLARRKAAAARAAPQLPALTLSQPQQLQLRQQQQLQLLLALLLRR